MANPSTTLAAVLALAMVAPAAAQSIPDGSKVRTLATGLGGGWLDGKLQMNESSGCE